MDNDQKQQELNNLFEYEDKISHLFDNHHHE